MHSDGDPPAAEEEDLLDVQIHAIMLQHAEDCKRMTPCDAGRLAMAALRSARAQQLRGGSGGATPDPGFAITV